MMKKIGIVLLVLFSAGLVFAQELDTPDPERIGVVAGQQKIKYVSIDKFETEGTWNVYMSSDEGVIKGRLFEGSPKDKEPIEDESGFNIPDEHVLGVRVDYFRRGYNSFTITPVRPLPVPGITKDVTVWVVGRNYNHVLKIMLKDFFGNNFELVGENNGKLNFQGWKKVTFTIPPQSGDGKHGIIQRDYHYNNRMGLKITGFKVECDPEDAYGSYYIYFDDLRAHTDLYAEESRDEDDMLDNW